MIVDIDQFIIDNTNGGLDKKSRGWWGEMSLSISPDKIYGLLKKYGNLVVDECAGNFECTMEDMDLPEEENEGYLDMDGHQVYPVLVRQSVLNVKNQIK